MRIVYSYGSRLGSASSLRASRTIAALRSAGHSILVMSGNIEKPFIYSLDLCTEALCWNYGDMFATTDAKLTNGVSFLSHVENFEKFVEVLERFKPELFVCDHEIFGAKFAKYFSVPLWYYSPLLLTFAFEWAKLPAHMAWFAEHPWLESCEVSYRVRWPQADRYLIPSFLAGLVDWKLKDGLEWVDPMFVKVNDKAENEKVYWPHLSRHRLPPKCFGEFGFDSSYVYNEAEHLEKLKTAGKMICQGETELIADALANKIAVLLSPVTKAEGNNYYPEGILNGMVLDKMSSIYNLWQVEFNEKYTLEILEKALNNVKPIEDWSPIGRNVVDLVNEYFE